MSARRFELHRDTDVTGVSGTGVVAEGIVFTGGVVALRWLSKWPTSVVFHDRGVQAVKAVHGHGGSTRIVWLDETQLCGAKGAAPDGTAFSCNCELGHDGPHADGLFDGGQLVWNDGDAVAHF